MKIAILVQLFPPKWLGGTEIATYNIAKELAKKGHEVHIITMADGRLSRKSREKDFYVHRLAWQKIKFLRIISLWLKIILLLKKINPEIIQAQGLGIALPAFLAKKFLRKPYIIYCRGSDVYLPWKFKSKIAKLVLKNADLVISLTNDMAKEVKKIYNREIKVIPNGIDLERFGNLSKDKTRQKLQIRGKEKIIIFIGGLKPVKGIQYLIMAMDIIRRKEPKAKLILVGGGEEKENLEKLVKKLNLKNNVNFVGKVPNEKVPEYLIASDIFVLSSLSEGFPNTVLEAMVSGLPIVATKVGGLAEIIKDGKNGFLVEPRNSQELAKKILLLLRDDNLRKRISRSSKEEVKKYSWENIIEKLEKIYINFS